MNVTVTRFLRPGSVRIEDATYSGAVADVFERGELTITGDRSAEELDVIPAGLWGTATVTDDNGYVAYQLVAGSEEMRKSA